MVFAWITTIFVLFTNWTFALYNTVVLSRKLGTTNIMNTNNKELFIFAGSESHCAALCLNTGDCEVFYFKSNFSSCVLRFYSSASNALYPIVLVSSTSDHEQVYIREDACMFYSFMTGKRVPRRQKTSRLLFIHMVNLKQFMRVEFLYFIISANSLFENFCKLNWFFKS